MTLRAFKRIAQSLMFCVWMCVAGFGQIRSAWFDVNPSQSNDGDNGGSGGRVNHVGAAADLSKVYAATEWGGLYQSFTQGNTWVRVNTFSPSATWDVKVDPSNSQRVYATSHFDGRVNPQSGISISNDAGNSWAAVNFSTLNTLTCGSKGIAAPQRKTEPSAWQIAIHPTTPSTVFIGTNCGLAVTTTSGAGWSFIDPSPTDKQAEQVYAVLVQAPQTVDVISDNGHFRSTDNGANWTPIPAPPGPVAANSSSLSTIAASPAESYVLLASGATDIFESDDGGATWPTSLALPLRDGNATNQGRIPFIKTNQLSTSTQFDVWWGDVNVYKTTARTPSPSSIGGPPRTPVNSWNNMQDSAHWDSGDVMFDPRASSGACPSFYTGDGGIFRNTKPNNPNCQSPSWSAPNITPHATWLWGFDGVRLSQGTHALTYGLQDDGGYAATNAKEGFNPPTPDWNNYTCCDVFHNSEGAGRILSLEGAAPGSRPFQVFIRNRDGGGGREINYPNPQAINAFIGGKQNAPFGGIGWTLNVCSPAPRNSCAGGDVYFTNNILAPGISWSGLASPTAGTSGTGNLRIANLQGFPNVYYHTGNGDPESGGLLFRSTLVGAARPPANWVPMGAPPGIGFITAYDIDPNNGNRVIFAGINSASNNFEIYITPDFGVTWNRLTNLENLMLGVTPGGPATFLNRVSQGRTSGFQSFGAYWQPSMFKFNPIDPNTIVAGAIDAGVFLSMDNGADWQLISNPTAPTSNSPHIPRPLYAYFSPGRFSASTSAFDVWVGTRGAGVMKVVIDNIPARR